VSFPRDRLEVGSQARAAHLQKKKKKKKRVGLGTSRVDSELTANGKSHTRRDDDLPHININIACSIPPTGRAKTRRYQTGRPREQVARSFLSFVTFDLLDSLLLLDAIRRFVFPVRGPSLFRVCLSNA